MAGLIDRARVAVSGENLLIVHTGGQPSVFTYQEELAAIGNGSDDAIDVHLDRATIDR